MLPKLYAAMLEAVLVLMLIIFVFLYFVFSFAASVPPRAGFLWCSTSPSQVLLGYFAPPHLGASGGLNPPFWRLRFGVRLILFRPAVAKQIVGTGSPEQAWRCRLAAGC